MAASLINIFVLFLLHFLSVFLFASTAGVAEAIGRWNPLFVFGDSYLDTGNHNHSDSPWQLPYGLTWPGRPAGRFSDGRVLTDFVAGTVGSSSPVPYRVCRREMRYRQKDIERLGVNFAVGGSGAYEAFDPRNLSVQVGYLKKMVKDDRFKLPPLHTTPALISIGGNDYAYYFLTNGSANELHELSSKVVGEIGKNLKRLHEIGVRRFAVSNLNPSGCLPYQTFTVSYSHCNELLNDLVKYHNRLLVRKVHETLSTLDGTDLIILDQFKSFSDVIKHPHLFGLQYGLKPCCESKLGNIPVCGRVDKDGKALYKVCSDPEKHLFWDGVHPTQSGWTKLAPLIFSGLQNPSNRKTHTLPTYNFVAWLRGNNSTFPSKPH